MTYLTIFSSYNKNGIIDDYLLFYLRKLSALSDVIIVCDNELSETELAKITDLSIHQICERHGEYDFGSYKRGYIWARENNLLENYDNLLICNDSVFGPFYDLQPYFEKAEKKNGIDFWGMFYEGDLKHPSPADYVQSYFMVFRAQVFQNKKFGEFLSKVERLDQKEKIVEMYELGMTQYLMKLGFKAWAHFSDKANAPHHKDALKLVDKGFPFLKRSLFNHNNVNIGCNELFAYKKRIGAKSSYDVKMVESHATRVFGEENYNLALRRRFNFLHKDIISRRFIKIRGRYQDNRSYRFTFAILGLRLLKLVVPKKWGYKNHVK